MAEERTGGNTSVGTWEKGAVLSECGTYRYRLWRHWGDGCDVVFVMLNPSTADHEVDDPTIRRCIGFARSWGFDGIEVVNLYALRATKPKALVGHPDPEGPGNVAAWEQAGMVPGMRTMVAAWGAGCHLAGIPGSKAFWTVAPSGYQCLGMTKGGDPRHPLYVRGDQPLVPFTTDAPVLDLGRTPDPCTCRPGTDGCPREPECFAWWQCDPEGFKSAYSGRCVEGCPTQCDHSSTGGKCDVCGLSQGAHSGRNQP